MGVVSQCRPFYNTLVAHVVCTINSSLATSDPATTLASLKAPELSLRSITDECADTYHEKLAAARNDKPTGKELGKSLMLDYVLFLDESGWAEHRTRDGYKYYYNRNTEEYSWIRPDKWSGISQDLSREEIQVSNTLY